MKDYSAFCNWVLSSIVLWDDSHPPYAWAEAVAMFVVNLPLSEFLNIVEILRLPSSSSAKLARARAVEVRFEQAPYNLNNVVERHRFVGLVRLFAFTLLLPPAEKPTKERGSPPTAGRWPYYVDGDIEAAAVDTCMMGDKVEGRVHFGVKEGGAGATTRKATEMESQIAGAVRHVSASSGEGQGEKKTAAPTCTYADLIRSSAAAVAEAEAAEASTPSLATESNDGVTVSLEMEEAAPVFGGVRDRVNTLEEHDDAAAGLAPAENTAEEKRVKGDGDD